MMSVLLGSYQSFHTEDLLIHMHHAIGHRFATEIFDHFLTTSAANLATPLGMRELKIQVLVRALCIIFSYQVPYDIWSLNFTQPPQCVERTGRPATKIYILKSGIPLNVNSNNRLPSSAETLLKTALALGEAALTSESPLFDVFNLRFPVACYVGYRLRVPD